MSPINNASTIGRRFVRTALPLDALRFVKDVAGVTVNDVALAIISSALRFSLRESGQLPTRSLVARIPVSIDRQDQTVRTSGNRFSALTTSLTTDVADPWERLLAVSAVTKEAKRLLALADPELLPDWLEQLPPAVCDRMVRRKERKRHTTPGRIDANIVVSNIRGPAQRLSLDSAPVEEIYVVGPPNGDIAVNVVLTNYGKDLFFGVLGFVEGLENPSTLTKAIGFALDELIGLAESR